MAPSGEKRDDERQNETAGNLDIDTSPDNRKFFLLCAKVATDAQIHTYNDVFVVSLTQMVVAWSKESVITEIITLSFWAI